MMADKKPPRRPKFIMSPKKQRPDKPTPTVGDEYLTNETPFVHLRDALDLAKATKNDTVSLGLPQAILSPVLHCYPKQDSVWGHGAAHGVVMDRLIPVLERIGSSYEKMHHYIYVCEVEDADNEDDDTSLVVGILIKKSGLCRSITVPYTINGNTVEWGEESVSNSPRGELRNLIFEQAD